MLVELYPGLVLIVVAGGLAAGQRTSLARAIRALDPDLRHRRFVKAAVSGVVFVASFMIYLLVIGDHWTVRETALSDPQLGRAAPFPHPRRILEIRSVRSAESSTGRPQQRAGRRAAVSASRRVIERTFGSDSRGGRSDPEPSICLLGRYGPRQRSSSERTSGMGDPVGAGPVVYIDRSDVRPERWDDLKAGIRTLGTAAEQLGRPAAEEGASTRGNASRPCKLF